MTVKMYTNYTGTITEEDYIKKLIQYEEDSKRLQKQIDADAKKIATLKNERKLADKAHNIDKSFSILEKIAEVQYRHNTNLDSRKTIDARYHVIIRRVVQWRKEHNAPLGF